MRKGKADITKSKGPDDAKLIEYFSEHDNAKLVSASVGRDAAGPG